MSKKIDKKTEETENQIAVLKSGMEEYKSKYLRALADYQNLEKRILGQREEYTRFAARKIITELLSVLDTLEKAEQHLNDEGLALAVKNFREVLRSEQVEKINVMHQKFDPLTMECIEVVPGEKEDEVIEEVRAGYKLNERVIRVARVKVSKKVGETKTEESAKEEL